MPVSIIQGDITRLTVDAIVNAANSSLLGGGGVDGTIHRAAGPGLLAECRTLGGCPTGEARITKGYDLPAKYVIHTVGPVWQGGSKGEPELLASCYRASLALAAENGCKTVAFPLISAGVYGYPRAEALKLALDSIAQHMDEDMTVYMVIFHSDRTLLDDALYDDISRRLRLGGMKTVTSGFRPRLNCSSAPPAPAGAPIPDFAAAFGMTEDSCDSAPIPCEEIYSESCDDHSSSALPAGLPFDDDLDRRLEQLDESFSQMLLRLIDSRGMTDAQCYKRANIDRKLFSKIRSDAHYRPSKPTVLAFAIALELDLEQTRELLMKAGFALSRSSRFDVIVEYFIEHGVYNIMDINAALFAFDQPLLAG